MQRYVRILAAMAAGALLAAVVLMAVRVQAQDSSVPDTIQGGVVMENQPAAPVIDPATGEVIEATARTFTYQGVLLNAAGAAVPNGTYNMTFTLYRNNTTSFWTEAQAVPVQEGFFAVRLGSVVPLPVGQFVDQQIFIGVRVGADAEMTPRQPLTQVPFAFVAERLRQFVAYGVVNADGSRRSGEGFSSTRNGQVYVITVQGENYNLSNYVTHITPLFNSSDANCQSGVLPMTSSGSGTLLVDLFNRSGGRVNCAFHFTVLDLP